MSYEGIRQLLCKNGHEEEIDAYDSAPEYCRHCGASWVWENGVDQTNGSYDEETGVRIDGYVELEIDVPAVKKKCWWCRHERIVEPTRYRIPTDTGFRLDAKQETKQ